MIYDNNPIHKRSIQAKIIQLDQVLIILLSLDDNQSFVFQGNPKKKFKATIDTKIWEWISNFTCLWSSALPHTHIHASGVERVEKSPLVIYPFLNSVWISPILSSENSAKWYISIILKCFVKCWKSCKLNQRKTVQWNRSVPWLSSHTSQTLRSSHTSRSNFRGKATSN